MPNARSRKKAKAAEDSAEASGGSEDEAVGLSQQIRRAEFAQQAPDTVAGADTAGTLAETDVPLVLASIVGAREHVGAHRSLDRPTEADTLGVAAVIPKPSPGRSPPTKVGRRPETIGPVQARGSVGKGLVHQQYVKKSAGIILCRIINGRLEALLVKKRFTYAFAEFTHSLYYSRFPKHPRANPRGAPRPPPGAVSGASDSGGEPAPGGSSAIRPPRRSGGRTLGETAVSAPANIRHGPAEPGHSSPLEAIVTLLGQMTVEELLDIWSLDFDRMWYRMWFSDHGDLYRRKRSYFEAAFMRDGGAALRAAVLRTHSRGSLLWEIPKGRTQSTRESDLACAIRELGEETNVQPSEYTLIPDAVRRVSYVSAGTRYLITYYVAIAHSRLAEGPAENPRRQTIREMCFQRVPQFTDGKWWDRSLFYKMVEQGEVSASRWYNIEQVRLLDRDAGPMGQTLEPIISPIFRLVRRFVRGRSPQGQHFGKGQRASRLRSLNWTAELCSELSTGGLRSLPPPLV